jgi:hypothetical protein
MKSNLEERMYTLMAKFGLKSDKFKTDDTLYHLESGEDLVSIISKNRDVLLRDNAALRHIKYKDVQKTSNTFRSSKSLQKLIDYSELNGFSLVLVKKKKVSPQIDTLAVNVFNYGKEYGIEEIYDFITELSSILNGFNANIPLKYADKICDITDKLGIEKDLRYLFGYGLSYMLNYGSPLRDFVNSKDKRVKALLCTNDLVIGTRAMNYLSRLMVVYDEIFSGLFESNLFMPLIEELAKLYILITYELAEETKLDIFNMFWDKAMLDLVEKYDDEYKDILTSPEGYSELKTELELNHKLNGPTEDVLKSAVDIVRSSKNVKAYKKVLDLMDDTFGYTLNK